MEKIDLKKVIEDTGASTDEVAMLLFPGNAYARQALKRVFDGKQELNSGQIIGLSKFLGVSIDDLYRNNGWKSGYDNCLITLEKGGYKAFYNTLTARTVIFDGGMQIYDEVMQPMCIPLGDFIEQITRIIDERINK